jgi:hypothetical protein
MTGRTKKLLVVGLAVLSLPVLAYTVAVIVALCHGTPLWEALMLPFWFMLMLILSIFGDGIHIN